MVDYAAVLTYDPVYAGRFWTIVDNDYATLEMTDGTKRPSEAELEKAWPQVQYQQSYARVEKARKVAYERDADPVFFQWQRGTATEQEWLDAVQAVKDAHPYPDPL